MSWVRVPPEAADFSQKKKILPQVSLNCVVFLCVCLEGVLKFVYHVYTLYVYILSSEYNMLIMLERHVVIFLFLNSFYFPLFLSLTFFSNIEIA